MEVEGGVMECDGAGMEFDEAGGGAGGGGQRLLSARRVMDREYEAEPDSLAGEQTWPTEAELAAVRLYHYCYYYYYYSSSSSSSS